MKKESQFFTSSIAATQLTDILSTKQGLDSIPTFRAFPCKISKIRNGCGNFKE